MLIWQVQTIWQVDYLAVEAVPYLDEDSSLIFHTETEIIMYTKEVWVTHQQSAGQVEGY